MKTVELEKTNLENENIKDIVVKENNKLNKYIWHILLIAITLVLLLISMKYFEDVNEIYSFNNFKYTIVTLIIWISEYLVLKGITNKTKISLAIVVGIEVVYDIINYVVRTVRGASITISDIFAIKTALTVTKNVNFQIESKFLLGMLFVIAIVIILVIFRKRFIEERKSWKLRASGVLIGITAIFILTQTNIYKSYSLWDMNETYRTLGTPITLLRQFYDFNVKPQKGYDKQEVQSLLQSYNGTQDEANNDESANIVVIVNESFCDYYNLYKEGNSDPIEYFTKLSKEKNVISGVMYSSEYGGQTSNVEYEFLTQNSTRILPTGSYVFQQYITAPVKNSIVHNLKSQGYKTSAIHPWERYAYSRNKIYQFFGFDSIKFKDDIDGLEENFNNNFFSDRSTYKELMKQIEEKKDGEKLFEYVLTVQNHIGYTNPDPNQITYSEDNSKNVYMQLIHESSEALKEVIDELSKKDEKYILLFFGDHQPNIDGRDDSVEKTIQQYEVPFLIWANYEIEEQYNIKTSTIFLQNYLLKAAGVKLSSINNYMEELKKYYPVITKRLYIDTYGNTYENGDKSDNSEKLEEYNKIDYYMIFDNNDHLGTVLFGS